MSDPKVTPVLNAPAKTGFFSRKPVRRTLDSILEPMKGIVSDLQEFRSAELAEKKVREEEIAERQRLNDAADVEIEKASQLVEKYQQLL